MDRRHFVAGSAAAVAALTVKPAFAQDAYPSRAVTVVNPFPPGGASDVVTRPLAAVLEPIIKQPVVIDTKAGAAGAVGAQVAANAKADGYTLLSHITSISGFAEVDRLFGRTPKFTRADFIPLARFVADPCVVIVNDQTPYKTLKDLTDDAKKRPDEIIFSSSGLYGALHIPMALYMKAAGGLKLRHLPTNGGGPALTALLGNNSQALASSVSACLAQIKAGKVRPLALFGDKRSKALPDVPTMKELGYPVEYYLWVGMFAPKGTPQPVVTYLRNALKQAAMTPQFATAMTNLGQDVEYLDQPEFAKFWDEDADRIEAAVREIGKVGVALLPSPAKRGEGSGVGVFAMTTDRRVAHARNFRRATTPAERKLWWHLRRLTLVTSHFRRQAPIGPYFVDFACHEHKLIIELDGESHTGARAISSDVRRTAYLQAHGYRVLRFWNHQVMNEIEGVLIVVQAAIDETQKSPPPLTPPRRSQALAGGGGNITMTLRADHVAGAAFIAFGALIIALSGDLPTGQLSMPGSGFLPKIVAVLTIIFGLALVLRGRESPPFAEVSFSDGQHALTVTVITAAAIALYTTLGFIITMAAMMIALLIVIERRNPLRAGAYSLAIVLLTYACFSFFLKTPLPQSPFSY